MVHHQVTVRGPVVENHCSAWWHLDVCDVIWWRDKKSPNFKRMDARWSRRGGRCRYISGHLLIESTPPPPPPNNNKWMWWVEGAWKMSFMTPSLTPLNTHWNPPPPFLHPTPSLLPLHPWSIDCQDGYLPKCFMPLPSQRKYELPLTLARGKRGFQRKHREEVLSFSFFSLQCANESREAISPEKGSEGWYKMDIRLDVNGKRK